MTTNCLTVNQPLIKTLVSIYSWLSVLWLFFLLFVVAPGYYMNYTQFPSLQLSTRAYAVSPTSNQLTIIKHQNNIMGGRWKSRNGMEIMQIENTFVYMTMFDNRPSECSTMKAGQ